jgi:membrane protein
LLLLWLFLCWVLFLMGAEVSYLHQYYLFYRRGFRANSLSRSQRESLTLLLFLHVACRFLNNQPLPSFSSLADSLNIPPHITRDLAQPLLKNGLLATATNHAVRLMPGKPLDNLTPAQILQSLDEDTPLHPPGSLTPESAACHRILQSRSAALQSGDLTKSIKEILLEQHQ